MSPAPGLPVASIFPLEALDPAGGMDDLEPLSRLIPADARVVAIGESAHGAHEYYALRHRLARFLVERMGFTALAWESGFPEGLLVDDYVQGRSSDRDRALLEGMTMHMGRCEEMAGFVDWLRAHNASCSNCATCHFYGLDLPTTGSTLLPVLDAVGAFLAIVDVSQGRRIARLIELASAFGPYTPPSPEERLTLGGAATVTQYVAIPQADRNELTSLLGELEVRLSSLRRVYVERSDASRYGLALQQLRVAQRLDLQLRAVASYMGGDAAACEANIRDLTMADTVEWILARHERVVVLAHNGHIQRMPIATPIGPVDTLGVHLAHRLGSRYVTIGTTCGGGVIIAPRTVQTATGMETELIIKDLAPAPADTLDGALDAALPGLSLLDLGKLGPRSSALFEPLRRMRLQDQFTDLDARQAFDLLVHVPRISLWTSPCNAKMPDTRRA